MTPEGDGLLLKYHWGTRAACVLAFLLFLWLTALMFWLGQPWPAMILLGFMLFSVYTYVTTTASTVLGAETVTTRRMRATHQIAWSEVTSVVASPSGSSRLGNGCVLVAPGKRFTIELTFWVAQRAEGRRRILEQIERRGLPVHPFSGEAFKNVGTRIG